jgi:hypothetical protein
MGNKISARSKDKAIPQCTEDVWPYVWAIGEPECLDWKIGKTDSFTEGTSLTHDLMMSISLQQQNLPVCISPHLYLSNHNSVTNIEQLQVRGITHVLNVAGPAARGPVQKYKEHGMQYKEIDAEDDETYLMLGLHLNECMVFINDAAAKKGVCVVHCAAGINRSGVIAAAYYLLTFQIPVLNVVAHCRRQRGNHFLLNTTFQLELVLLARKHGLLGPPPGLQTGSCVSASAPTLDVYDRKTGTTTFSAANVKKLFE